MGIVTAAPNPNEPTTKQLSDGNGENGGGGTVFGTSAEDTISFFGKQPCVTQPSGSDLAAISSGLAGVGTSNAAITVYTSTQSPSAVNANTTAEQSITVTGVLATDLVIINKPTSQAGLGLLASRVSAANTVALTFANVTASQLTPTASQAYIVATIPANLQISATLSPAAVAAKTVVEQTFTVQGVSPGMITQVNKPTEQAGLGVLSSRVIDANTLAITFVNTTSGVLTPNASEVYTVAALNGLVSASLINVMGVNVGTLTGVAGATTAEQAVTVAGVAATDVIVGVSKPSLQAGIAAVGGRVSAANTVQLLFVNSTASTQITPTASEVYKVTVFSPTAVAPLSVLTSAVLTPGSMAANTTAEQTFTVTGLVSGQPVMAEPNYNISSPPGIGIAGVRASGANTLAITFVNTTSSAITPPAGTWTVAQFNQATPTAGNYVQQMASPLQTTGATLTNSIQGALVELGLISAA